MDLRCIEMTYNELTLYCKPSKINEQRLIYCCNINGAISCIKCEDITRRYFPNIVRRVMIKLFPLKLGFQFILPNIKASAQY